MSKLKIYEFTKKSSEEVCTNCQTVVRNPATCKRCADGHGDIEPLCEGCIFIDEYYDTVCDHCHGYLLENK